MPIYEFQCDDCGHTFEIINIRTDDVVEMQCPKCSSLNLQRLIGAANFAMSGGKSIQDSPRIKHRSCSSGNCSSVTLPGHTR